MGRGLHVELVDRSVDLCCVLLILYLARCWPHAGFPSLTYINFNIPCLTAGKSSGNVEITILATTR